MSNLKAKLLLAFLSAVVIPLAVTNWIVIDETKSFSMESFQKSFLNEVKHIENSVNLMFRLYHNHVNLLSEQPEFERAKLSISRYMNQAGNVQLSPNIETGPEADVYNLFTTISKNFPDLAYLYYGTEQGGYLQWPLGGLTDNYDPRLRPWYLTAKRAKGNTVRVPAYYWAADDSTVISTVKYLYDQQSNPMGVIGMDITLSKFTEILESVDFGLEGSLIVVEDSGRVLANTQNSDLVFKFSDDIYDGQLALNNNDLLPESLLIDQKPHIVTSYFSEELNWIFIGIIPQHAVDNQVKGLSLSILSVALIAIISFSIGVFILSNYIAKIIEIKQRQLLKAKSIAEQASQAKSQFLANMSHEIRTPLNGVLGMTQLLAMTDLNLNQKEKLKTIESSGKLLMEIINDILDFSKIEAQKLELYPVTTDLVELVTNIALSHHANVVRKNLELVIDTSEILDLKVEIDDVRLSQVLGNLLSNAIKFTEKGHILVKCRSLLIDDPDNVLLEFQISDTGIGMNKQQQQTIFAAFAQADESTTRKYGGTGLGLALCLSIIELMGGELKVFSQPNKGSVFKFKLKLPVKPSDSNHEKLLNLQKLFVVVVEPIAVNLKIIRQYLKRCGAEFKTFEDEQDAKEFLRRKPHVDVIFVAENLCEMSGVSFYQYVTRLLPKDCRRFLLTNIEQSQTPDETLAMVSAVFVKPISEKRLNGFLTHHLDMVEDDDKKFNGSEVSLDSGFHGESVLVVEDNLINFKVVEKFLHSLGLKAERADCGETGVDLFIKHDYPLVLMDCMLPGIDGYQATRKIRQLESDNNRTPTHIIALTADVTQENKQKCLDAGMNNYVGKPFDFEVLKKAISEGLN